MPTLTLRDYNERCVLLEGDTSLFKTKIKEEMKGLWNDSLKGWIFPKTRKSDVEEFVRKVNIGTIEPEVDDERKQHITRVEFMTLVTRIEKLEAEMRQGNKVEKVPVVIIPDEAEYEEPKGITKFKRSGGGKN